MKLDFDIEDVLTPKDIAAINAGTKRAVGDKERLEQLLAQAAQFGNDILPANHTPMKFLCVQYGKLKTHADMLRKVILDGQKPVIAMDPDTCRFAELPRLVAQFVGHIEVKRGWAP